MEMEKKSEEIKELIKKIAEYDIVGSYYNKEMKTEIAVAFKKLLNYDDLLIRKFIEQVFDSFKTLANDNDLMPTATDEVGTEEDKEAQEDMETPEEIPEEENPEEHEAEETPEEETEEHASGEELPDEEEVKAESVKFTRGHLMTEQALNFLD